MLNILTEVIQTGDKKFGGRVHMFSSPGNEWGEGEEEGEGSREDSRVQLFYTEFLLTRCLAFK